MQELFVGFSRVDITPPMGLNINGYYKVRLTDGILDPLQINTLAFRVGETRAVLCSIDNCQMESWIHRQLCQAVMEATGLPEEAVFVHTTHTHTAAEVNPASKVQAELDYVEFVKKRLAEGALLALDDLKPARMGYAVGKAPNIAFVRRFRMKDGSIQTNPGVGNPEILCPIGDVDERVNVLRFDREQDTLVLANFGCHPDTVGGCKVSADWPGFTRRRLEKALDNVKCVFFNGAEGDVNHVKVDAKGGDLNDMFHDFDDVSRGYGHSRHMGNVVAGAILQVFDKVTYTDVPRLKVLRRGIEIPSNMPTQAELSNARAIEALHQAGRDADIPFKGMMLTTVVAEAERMLRLEHGPESFPMQLAGVALGPVAFVGIPGEPFTQIGRDLKQAPGWELVLPCCQTNGADGYFPTRDAYDEGGYEARSSPFRAGVAEYIMQEGRALLEDLKKD